MGKRGRLVTCGSGCGEKLWYTMPDDDSGKGKMDSAMKSRRRPLELSFDYIDTPERRVLSLAADGRLGRRRPRLCHAAALRRAVQARHGPDATRMAADVRKMTNVISRTTFCRTCDIIKMFLPRYVPVWSCWQCHGVRKTERKRRWNRAELAVWGRVAFGPLR